mgnify:CR=1 FL=1
MAVSIIVAAASTAVGVVAGTIAISSAFTYFLVSTAMGAALNALSPKPSLGGSRGYSIGGENGSAVDHQIIYGETRVGGVRIYDASTGENNNVLHRILAFAGHEIDSYQEIYLNDEIVDLGDAYTYEVSYITTTNNVQTTQTVTLGGTEGTPVDLPVGAISFADFTSLGGELTATWVSGSIVSKTFIVGGKVKSPSRYNGKITIKRFYGTFGQEPDPDLIAETVGLEEGAWTSDHRLRGIAYLYIRFEHDAEAFPNGVPVVSATIRGKKVYDPRTNTTAWSDNPALCLRDYIRSDYGLDQTASKIDDDLVITAADVCDELVNGEKRYTCNGNFTTGFQPSQIISDMLTSMGGLFWYSQGKWRMKAAKYTTPEITFDEGDLRSGISLSTRHSRRSNFNTVKGKFKGPETNYQEADYPEVSEEEFIETDNGLVNTLDLLLPFTDSSTMAQRIANIALRRNREQLTFTASFGLRAFGVQVGDFIKINNTRFGWSEKVFEVTNWDFALTDELDLQVQMTLREISPAVFTLKDPAAFENNNTTLPDPSIVTDVGVSVSGELQVVNEQVSGVMLVDFTYDASNIDYVQFQYKKSTSNNWKNFGRVDGGRAEVIGIADGTYDVRARAVNFFGYKGHWSYVFEQDLELFAAPPADVEDFSGNVIASSLYLTWSPVADLDLSHYRVRYSKLTSGATYSKAIDITKKVARPANSVVVPALTGTYFVRAYDKLGNGSENPSSIVVVTDPANLQRLNLIQNLTQNPTFTGSKSNVALSDINGTPCLVLETSTLFDDTTGDFDSAEGLFDGKGGVVSKGTYTFANSIDLGEKYTSRIRATIGIERADYNDLFDGRTGKFDAAQGQFDGSPNTYDDISAKVQVSYTDDDPAGSPTWSAWQDVVVGDVTGRAMRFRAILLSSNTASSPAVTELNVRVDMPDRIESDNNLSFTGSTTVTFDTPFRVVPAIGLSLANLTNGQRYALTSKTRSGFTITVYNSDGSVASNSVTLDYVAKGYGKVL